MGSSISAECPCGFKTGTMLTGGGMLNFETLDRQPCLCRDCHLLFGGNMKQTPVLCPVCAREAVPYERGGLGDGPYECPKCGKDTLVFTMGLICWD